KEFPVDYTGGCRAKLAPKKKWAISPLISPPPRLTHRQHRRTNSFASLEYGLFCGNSTAAILAQRLPLLNSPPDPIPLWPPPKESNNKLPVRRFSCKPP